MSDAFLVLTPPALEPITLSDAKDHLNIDFADKDTLITNAISRARAFAETVTGRALAYQQVQHVFTIDRPQGGELSGPITPGPSWYEYNEALGANPFGPAMYYYDLAMPPIDRVQQVTIETKVIVFDQWTTFTQSTNPDGSTNTWVDYSQEPARIYIQNPITANMYRFTYWAGYGNTNTEILPFDLREALLELIAHFYDNRAGEDVPPWILNKLLARRVASAWA